MGSIDWIATVAGDPPRTTLRLPIGYELAGRAGREGPPGFLLVTGRTADSVHLATYEQNPWGAATRTISVALESNGALRGPALVEQLVRSAQEPHR
jgi:hypothetical protein